VELVPGLDGPMKDEIVASMAARRAAALFLDAADAGDTNAPPVSAPPAHAEYTGMYEPMEGAPVLPPHAAPSATTAAMEV